MAPTLDLSLSLSTADALEHVSGVMEAEEILTEEVLFCRKQKEMSYTVDEKLQKKHVDSVENVRDKARLNSVCLPHSGDWLFVVPAPALGLQLRNAEFRCSALYRLGMPVFETDGDCLACGQWSDRFGDHAIGCASQGERIARHNHLRDALYHTAQSASLVPLREERALLPGLAGDRRPADVLLPNNAVRVRVTYGSPLKLQK